MPDRAIVWQPTPEYTRHSALRRFMDQQQIASYTDLLRRSEAGVAWFWDAFIRFAGIEFYQPYSQVLDLSRGLPFPRWFLDGRINVAHNALDKWADNPETANRVALIWESEAGAVERFSYAQLQAAANQAANALHALGIQPGDRVGLFMPLIPQTVIAVFGIYKLGAVAVPLFSGFGPEAVALRLRDVAARAVFTADGFYRGGRRHDLKATLDRALTSVPSVEAVIVAQHAGDCPMTAGRDHLWSQSVTAQASRFATRHTDAEDICMVSFSSGTSGKPKGIVQVHGGVAVKAAQVGILLYDARPADIVHQITDFGWMMGQAPILRVFSAGGALLLYEGAPTYPHPGRVFDLIEKHGVTMFGATATALRMLKASASAALAAADLRSLRLLTHTGELIDDDTWLWYFAWGAGRLPILNVSGGTELFAEIISSTYMQPLKPTCLGVTPAIAPVAVDERGQPVPPGQPGYLAFTLPQPAQTRGFWNEPDTRYLETYFPYGPHLWWHGDLVKVDSDGFWFHCGRADDVLKVAGRKTGPGEIEAVINQFPGVLESAVIGVPHDLKGEDIVAFVVLRPGATVTPTAVSERIVSALGKPFQPGAVHLVADLPRTRTAKIIRRLIRQRYLGEPYGDLSSLANPEALDMLPVRAQ